MNGIYVTKHQSFDKNTFLKKFKPNINRFNKKYDTWALVIALCINMIVMELVATARFNNYIPDNIAIITFVFLSATLTLFGFLLASFNSFHTEYNISHKIFHNALFAYFKDLKIKNFQNSLSYKNIYTDKINIPLFKKACEMVMHTYRTGTYKAHPIRIALLKNTGSFRNYLFVSTQMKSNNPKSSIIIANKQFYYDKNPEYNTIHSDLSEFEQYYQVQTKGELISDKLILSTELTKKLLLIKNKGFNIAICKHFDHFDIIVYTSSIHMFDTPSKAIPHISIQAELIYEILQLIDILKEETSILPNTLSNIVNPISTTHQNKNDFQQFFMLDETPTLLEIERLRLDTKKKIRSCILQSSIPIALIQLLSCVFLISEPDLISLGATIFSSIFLLTIIYAIPKENKNYYIKNTKAKLYDFLFSYFGDFECLSNEPTGRNWDYYKTIPLFKNYNISPYIDDRFKGIYNGILVNIEELKLNAIKGKVFDGLLFYFPYEHKKCKSTVITTNKSYPYAAKTLDRVKLEDIEFEKIYETYSNDQIEARYILTTAFMEKLKRLNKHNIKAAVCFHNGMVYIGVKTTKNLFEPPLFKSALDIENYKSLINQMKEILEIIDILEMDRKTLL